MFQDESSFRQHLCILYKDANQLAVLCRRLIQVSADKGFRWLYVVGERRVDEIFEALERSSTTPLPPGDVIDGSKLGLLEASPSFDSIIDELEDLQNGAVDEGFAGLFILVEMTWALNLWPTVAYIAEYEVELQRRLVSDKFRTVCLYNQHVFPAPMLLDSLRTHPGIYSIDGAYKNPHFLPPEIFLSRDARAQLATWLGNIHPKMAELQNGSSSDGGEADSGFVPPANPTLNITKTPIYKFESPTPLVAQNVEHQRWKIHALGRLRVYDQDGSEVQWNLIPGATLKTKTLFAYLLHRGQEGATAEELADLLWPDAGSMKKSLNRLYHTVHCLRTALSPEMDSGRESSFVLNYDNRYFLALPPGTWIDIPVFEQLCYRGEHLLHENKNGEALICHKAAEKLYSGDLLADLPLIYVENLDHDWCWSDRYWLREMYMKMLSDMAQIYRRDGDARRAIAYCEKALKIDPCAEKSHMEMMRVFHMTGRRDALERQYRLYGEALQRYEGRPSSETIHLLYESLVATM